MSEFAWYEVPLLHPWPDQVLKNRRERSRVKKARKRARDKGLEYVESDNPAQRSFVGWDGEGRSLEDGSHIYTLLANSDGSYIRRRDDGPLSTKACLDFLLRIGTTHPGVYHVGFAFTYDVNMILGDLPEEELRAIYDPPPGKKWTYCPSIHTSIIYHPHKTFQLRRKVMSPDRGVYNAYFKLDDVFTFFSCKFETACKEYLGENYPGSALIAEGKALRSKSFAGFTPDQVLKYCQAELRALVALMEELRSRLEYVDIRPRDWHGPGAISMRVLQKYNLKAYKGDLISPIEQAGLPLALRHSYAGGRFEVFQYGAVEGSVWRYDRRSAYPYAMTQLHSDIGSWEHVTGWVDQEWREGEGYKLPLGIYWVTWDNRMLPKPWQPQPLFKRSAGTFCYPYKHTGWVWSYELEQMLRLPYGRVSWDEAWLYHPDDPEVRPFRFVKEMYDERRRLKAANHPAQYALKIALNALYGKLIQQKGWKPLDEGSHIPPYFCLSWASQITSITRAALLKVVIDNEIYDDLISFETDALFCKQPLSEIAIGEELGEWEEKELHGFVNVQSGIYGSDEQPHVRGMQRIAWPEDPLGMMRQLLQDRYKPYEYTINTFISLGDGLKDLSRWRRWIDIPRSVTTMEPTNGLGKRNHDILHCACDGKEENQLGTWHTTAVYPKAWRGLAMRAYELEWLPEEREIFDVDASEVEGYYD